MKRYFVTAEQLRQIVEQYPTPFHLYDEAGIRAMLGGFKVSWNPRFRIISP